VATLETEVGGKIILQLYFRKDMWECGLDSSGPRYGPVGGGSCEHSN
jgi:hypothetical protein